MKLYSSTKPSIKVLLPACVLTMLFTTIQTYAAGVAKEISSSLNVMPVSWSVSYINEQVTIQWQLSGISRMKHIFMEKTTDRQHHEQVALTTDKENPYVINYTFQDSADRTDSLYFRLNMRDIDEKMSYSAYLVLPPLQQSLKVKIYPQPANGGDIYLSFNKHLVQQVHITIQDLLGKTYYNGWHPAENHLLVRFGQQFPAISPGSYQLTVTSAELIVKKIFFIE